MKFESDQKPAAGCGGTNTANSADGILVRAGFSHVRPIIRSGWKAMLFCICVFLATALFFLSAGPNYETTVSVAPYQTSSSGLGSSSGLSGLATLAGISTTNNVPLSSYEQFLLTIHSTELARKLLSSDKMMKSLFKAYWNPQQKAWIKPQSTPATFGSAIDKLFGFESRQVVSVEDVRRYLENNVDISGNKDNSVRVISVKTKNPSDGLYILNNIYKMSDDIVRQSDAFRLKEQAEFINAKLQSVTVTEHRQALADLLSEYEKRYLLTQSALSYAFRTVDAPALATRPISPRPIVVLILVPIVGFLIGFSIASVLYARNLVLMKTADEQ